MRGTSLLLFSLSASPALAASGPLVSLHNTNFVVLIAFLVFIGILVYYGVPKLLGGQLDKRAETIRAELDEARKIREEAQSLLASYERKAREVETKAEQIVEHAKSEAQAAAEQAKKDIEVSIARRLQAAEDKIASAEAAALKDVRDRATDIAVAAAAEVLKAQMTSDRSAALIDEAIGAVEAKLH